MGWGNAWILKGVYEIYCFIKVKNMLLILYLTRKLNVAKFHVCTYYLNHRNEKCSLLATKGQTLGNEHFLLSFLQILIGNSRGKKQGIMVNPSSRDKSRSSNISRPKILMTASRLFFYKNDFHYSYVSYH